MFLKRALSVVLPWQPGSARGAAHLVEGLRLRGEPRKHLEHLIVLLIAAVAYSRSPYSVAARGFRGPGKLTCDFRQVVDAVSAFRQ